MKKILLLFLLVSIQTFAIENANLIQANNMLQKSQWAFEENKGQVTGEDAKNVMYFLKEGNMTMFLMEAGIAYQFNKTYYPEGFKSLDKFAKPEEMEKMDALRKNIRTESYRMDVSLEGANKNYKISTEGRSEDYINYYNHNALEVRSYKKVTYYNVYPKIDWVVYINEKANSEASKVKYDFVVHPGGDPSLIKLKTNWVENLSLNEDGDLILRSRMGKVIEQKPISYQCGKEVKTNFKIQKNNFHNRFYFRNWFRRNEDIIIKYFYSFTTLFISCITPLFLRMS